MITWPENKNEAEEVCELNHNGTGGFFPVGVNNQWHSGIHIPSSLPVFPLIEGELVAYRLGGTDDGGPNGEVLVNRPFKNISRDEYVLLTDEQKSYYVKDINSRVDRLVLKDPDSDDLPKDSYSHNFILLKHYMSLPAGGSGVRKVTFFTLYTNLNPYNFLSDEEDEFKRLRAADRDKRIFYEKWIFKVSEETPPIMNYSYNGQTYTDVFPGSAFMIYSNQNFHTLQDEDSLRVVLLANTSWITVRKSDVLIWSTFYLKAGANVSAYLMGTESLDDLEDNCIASLKQGAEVELVENPFGEESWTRREGYIPVRIRGAAVESRTMHGWIWRSAYEGVTYEGDSNTYFDMVKSSGGENPEDFNHVLYHFEEISADEDIYKIVKFEDYLSALGEEEINLESLKTTGSWVTGIDESVTEEDMGLPDDGLYCVVLKPGLKAFAPGESKQERTQYAFYLSPENCAVSPLPLGEEAVFRDTLIDEAQNGIQALSVEDRQEFFYDNNLEQNRQRDRFIAHSDQNISAITGDFCRVSYYITGAKSRRCVYLVKATDFSPAKNGTRGQLKENLQERMVLSDQTGLIYHTIYSRAEEDDEEVEKVFFPGGVLARGEEFELKKDQNLVYDFRATYYMFRDDEDK
ncbi:MAG: hypothetical protein PQJ60_07550, partial [Spirochaetales bacterium]|nr:hypothetical protein [Spirochaetales bacterium]